ncbi:MAG: choice-of-anchor D domain-containing protein, partial [Calditrichia bacterium]
TLFASVLLFSSLQAQQLHRLGLLKEDPAQLEWLQKAPEFPVEGLTGSHFNLQHLPPVGNQGSQGSCTAWAVSYYFKTHQEASEKLWDTSLPEHQCSPAFIYNLINGGEDGGSFISDAFLALEDFGAGTMADMPYNAGNFTDWPGERAFENGMPFRTQATYFISTTSNYGISQIKSVLSTGKVLVIGISVYPNFDNISSYNYTYCVNDVTGGVRGGHAVTIVGYDDSKVTSDGVGAFRMINSWGTNWGQQGYWWMSYEAVKSTLICHGSAYYADDRLNYEPQLVARYQLNHPHRSSVQVKVGVGTPQSSAWQHTYFDFYMNQWNNPAQQYPHNPILLDATDGASFLMPGSQDNFYLQVKDTRADGLTGSVQFFRGESHTQRLSATAHNLPQLMPEQANVAVPVPIGGDLSIYPLSFGFDGIMMGDTAVQYLELKNLGSTSENLDFQWDNSGSASFHVDRNLVSLSAMQEDSVQVIYTPPVQAAEENHLQITGQYFGAFLPVSGKSRGSLSLNQQQFDFGQVNVGSDSSATFTIYNEAAISVPVTLNLTGANPGHFQVIPDQANIAANDSLQITAVFAPLSPEFKSGIVNIEGPGQAYAIDLSGSGKGISQLNIPQQTLRKSVLLADSMMGVVELFNNGSSVLTYDVVLNPGGSGNWAEIMQPFGSIAPGSSKKLLIRLRGQAVGLHQGTCTITTNEPGGGQHDIPVSLTVVELPVSIHYQPCYSGGPLNPMQIFVTQAVYNGVELEAGDEISVYDNGICVGSAMLHYTAGPSINALKIEASQDDPATTAIDGFTEGHEITFKIWDRDLAIEYMTNEIQFTSSTGQTLPVQPFSANTMAYVRLGMLSGIDDQAAPMPVKAFALHQNYPNPFNPSTRIQYDIPQNNLPVRLQIFNILGQQVSELVNENQSAGSYTVSWNGRNTQGQAVPSGMYIARIEAGSYSQSIKLILMK